MAHWGSKYINPNNRPELNESLSSHLNNLTSQKTPRCWCTILHKISQTAELLNQRSEAPQTHRLNSYLVLFPAKNCITMSLKWGFSSPHGTKRYWLSTSSLVKYSPKVLTLNSNMALCCLRGHWKQKRGEGETVYLSSWDRSFCK